MSTSPKPPFVAGLGLPRVEQLYDHFVAAEVLISLRHAVVNDLTAISTLCFPLRKLLEQRGEQSPHNPSGDNPSGGAEILGRIQGYISSAALKMQRSFVAPRSPLASKVTGKAAGKASPLDGSELINGLLRHVVTPPGIQVAGPGSCPTWMQGAEEEIELAMACLLANTFEAVQPGDRVRISCHLEDAETVAVDFSHDGEALDPEVRRHMFEAFFSGKPGHLGLGLNIAQRIAGRWGGSLEVKEPPTGGVAAVLRLPAWPKEHKITATSSNERYQQPVVTDC